MKTFIYTIMLVLFYTVTSYGTGVIVPSDKDYPYDLLKLNISEITVNINGNLAETIVYEEFENEWDKVIKGVYSFPLPQDARCTGISYWRNDSLFQAELKVQSQEPNPGTGDGGIAAEVNEYVGEHGVTIKFIGIKPGDVQKVELRYVTLLEQQAGTYYYKYPLNTSRFVEYPLDYLDIQMNIETPNTIAAYDVISGHKYSTSNETDNSLTVSTFESKAYIDKDYEFAYSVEDDGTEMQFVSNNLTQTGGHFVFFYNSPAEPETGTLRPNRVIFLLESGSAIYGGIKLSAINAIKEGLDLLDENDMFNVVLYYGGIYDWKSEFVEATPANIAAAKQFLDETSTPSGIDLQNALTHSLDFFDNAEFNNSIILFGQGRSEIEPSVIANKNDNSVGIISVGIGDKADKEKLELISHYNFGFTEYIDPQSYSRNEVLRFYEKALSPKIASPAINFYKSDVKDKYPSPVYAMYLGSTNMVAGKYTSAGDAQVRVNGSSDAFSVDDTYDLTFAADSSANVADKIWAKEVIDHYERQIAVYGESEDMKNRLIDVSLTYGIRCRYTAYVATYEDGVSTGVDEKNEEIIPYDFTRIETNYPNPFNPTTNIRFFISANDAGAVKFIKIYNMLGQLIRVIDVSGLQAGWHEVMFNGIGFDGNKIASGVYFVSLQVNDNIKSTIKIVMMK